MTEPDAGRNPIAGLSEIGALLDDAPRTIKHDISRIKKLLADPDAVLPLPIVALTLEDARAAFDLLTLHARQLQAWQDADIAEADRAEVTRLQHMIPQIRPLIQRLIALATELDTRARTGVASPRKKWRH